MSNAIFREASRKVEQDCIPASIFLHLQRTEKFLQIHWRETSPDSYKVYAVYYRPEDSDSDYKMLKTSENELVLTGLDPNTNYELALVSANALGHSPFVEAKIINNYHGWRVLSNGYSPFLLLYFTVFARPALHCKCFFANSHTVAVLSAALHSLHQIK